MPEGQQRFEITEGGACSGELIVDLSVTPASLQGSKKRKEAVRKAIQAALTQYRFILTGEVKVDVEWMSTEHERYKRPVQLPMLATF